MEFSHIYKSLKKQSYSLGDYKIVPIRYDDRLAIMEWRNDQIYHLRQAKSLTEDDQNNYFDNVISLLFDQEKPNQILFSYLKNGKCIGYGGLVHINWIDQNAEISFVLNTVLENEHFELHWQKFLNLIEKVAFDELSMHKIYTYAFDLRPNLYVVLEDSGYRKEAILNEHCLFDNNYIDVVIHSKLNYIKKLELRKAIRRDSKLYFEWVNDKVVRENSINMEPIEWENHLICFETKLRDLDNAKLFVLCENKTPVGQIRFELNQENEWVIDYTIAKKFRGKGYGTKIVLLGIQDLPSGSLIKAIVKQNNVSSSKVFERLNFNKKVENVDEQWFFTYRLIKE